MAAKILLSFGIQALGVSLETLVTMRVLFLIPYPEGEAPSQRFRFEQYLDRFRSEGFDIVTSSFLDLAAWRILYSPGWFFGKFTGLLRGYLRRFRDLATIGRYDFVFIHREASPFGPPWIEWMIVKILRKKIVFDFDDAIWIPNSSRSNRRFANGMKSFSKTGKIIRWSTLVLAGNGYLADYARRFNSNVQVIPTTIDTVGLHNSHVKHDNKLPVIGWTGSHSTLPLLASLFPVLKRLRESVDFSLRVVCDTAPDFELPGMVFVPWSKENEIQELLKFDVGIMPMPDNEWTRGKCGFKALQYMALGIPAVVSPVGVNAEIVDHGLNGLHCTTPDEWFNGLSRLLQDRSLLIELSKACRNRVESRYSVLSQQEKYVALLREVGKRR